MGAPLSVASQVTLGWVPYGMPSKVAVMVSDVFMNPRDGTEMWTANGTEGVELVEDDG